MPNQLLTRGNDKLGEGIHAFSLPAVLTCPGASAVCRAECYAVKGRFRRAIIAARYATNYRASKRADFTARMTAEIRAHGVRTVRVHVAGDFYSAAYVRRWHRIAAALPRVRFYAYSRSWRKARIAAALAELAALPNVRLWYSTDSDTGYPTHVPPGVRVAYLQTDPEQTPPDAQLVFRTHRLRRVALAVVSLDRPAGSLERRRAPVCPPENGTPAGRALNCGACGICHHD